MRLLLASGVMASVLCAPMVRADEGQAGAVSAAAAGEEVEVTFEEEVDRAGAGGLMPLPKYRYSRWLLLLPALGVLVCAWNVAWRRPRKPTFVPRAIQPPAPPTTRTEP